MTDRETRSDSRLSLTILFDAFVSLVKRGADDVYLLGGQNVLRTAREWYIQLKAPG